MPTTASNPATPPSTTQRGKLTRLPRRANDTAGGRERRASLRGTAARTGDTRPPIVRAARSTTSPTRRGPLENLDASILYNAHARSERKLLTLDYLARELSEQTGMRITKQHISGWLHNQRPIPIAVMPHLARMYHLNPADFPEYTARTTPARFFLYPEIRALYPYFEKIDRKYGGLVPPDSDLAMAIRLLMRVSDEQYENIMSLLTWIATGEHDEALRALLVTAQQLQDQQRQETSATEHPDHTDTTNAAPTNATTPVAVSDEAALVEA